VTGTYDPCPGSGTRPEPGTVTYQTARGACRATHGSCPHCGRPALTLTRRGVLHVHKDTREKKTMNERQALAWAAGLLRTLLASPHGLAAAGDLDDYARSM
jgi:hypothetical protein